MSASPARNIALYPWFKFLQNLLFWQAVWFLYFQSTLSPTQAILLYAVYDVATTLLEVPSGYMSDRLGRRFTLWVSSVCSVAGLLLLATGDSFVVFVAAQVLIGAGMAFSSGTDSALLYESLEASGRQTEIEEHELRAWRYSYIALALSAAIGGVMAWYADTAPFWASTGTALCVVVLCLMFRNPPATLRETPPDGTALNSLKQAVLHPVLLWLFGLTVLMYGFSHIPYVFGQPFILEALDGIGLASEAPVISGAVSAIMMGASVAASLWAPALRRKLGVPGLLLTAFGMQIALVGVLSLTNAAIAIVFLFLRMVPDALSRPFILAQIQPMLSDDSRATYLSLQSFCARLLFAASLYVASHTAGSAGDMAYSEIRVVLGWYLLAGVAGLAALAITARHMNIGALKAETPQE